MVESSWAWRHALSYVCLASQSGQVLLGTYKSSPPPKTLVSSSLAVSERTLGIDDARACKTAHVGRDGEVTHECERGCTRGEREGERESERERGRESAREREREPLASTRLLLSGGIAPLRKVELHAQQCELVGDTAKRLDLILDEAQRSLGVALLQLTKCLWVREQERARRHVSKRSS